MKLLEVLQFLESETCVTQLRCATNEGTFLVSIRDQVVGVDLALHGSWESPETNFVKGILRPGDFVIDAGANFGWYTVVCAQAVGITGRVLAFEPEQLNHDLLKENVLANGANQQVSLYQTALLDTERAAQLCVSGHNFGDHQIFFGENTVENAAEETTITVTAQTLDSVMKRDFQPIESVRLLKIDCQGAEIPILHGAKETLGKVDFLLIEFSPGSWEQRGFQLSEFEDLMIGHFAQFTRVGDPIFPESEFQPISLLKEDMQKPLKNYTNYAFARVAV
jgi:FkbM family methyltransferase